MDIQKIIDEAWEGRATLKPTKALRGAVEKVIAGPNPELADRARTHLRIAEQRIAPSEQATPRRGPNGACASSGPPGMRGDRS